MRKVLKIVAALIVVAAVAAAGFVFIYAPYRAGQLEAKYAGFRAAFQAEHDAIDARFNQQDRVVNGLKWHYVDEGARDAPVVVFMHGLPEGWYSWSKVLPAVDHAYRLIAIDMKGYGRSDLADTDYDWHTVARQTLDLMTSLGIDRFYVVGHDWGTVISSVMVGDHPEHILGYVRMEADLVPRGTSSLWAFYQQKPQWLLFQSNWIATYLMRDPGWFIDTVYPPRLVTQFDPTDRNYFVYEFSRPGVAETNPRYFARGNWDLDAVTTTICKNSLGFPVLQLQADSDSSQPQSLFADVATACPNVRLEWVTNASHFDNLDQPGQVAAAINNFLHSSKRD